MQLVFLVIDNICFTLLNSNPLYMQFSGNILGCIKISTKGETTQSR
jgi:uncharacterized membrane protein